MTERRGDQGFSFPPRRLDDDSGDGRSRRRRRLGVAIVAAIAAGTFAIAWLGPRLSDRPSFDVAFFATPTPALTPTSSALGIPTPTSFGPTGATPLPEITRREGAVALGQVAIDADGLRVLDLATGRIEPGADATLGRDAVVRALDGGGWTCVCFADTIVDNKQSRIVRIVGVGPTGLQTDSTDVVILPGAIPDESRPPDPATDVDIRDDGRSGLLAVASRAADRWQFSVVALDVDRRRVGPSVKLGVAALAAASPLPSPPPRAAAAAPTPTIPEDIFLDGPHVRLAPGGRVAFVWGIVQRNSQDAVTATAVRAWRVALGADGSVSDAAEVHGFDHLPSFCNAIGFASPDRLAWLCPEFAPGPGPTVEPGWVLGTIGLDGRPAGTLEIPADQPGFFGEPLFDRANGQVYAWDSTGLTMRRFDVHAPTSDIVTFDPSASVATGVAPGGGTAGPDWRDADSAVQILAFSQVAGSPDGARLYALGFKQMSSFDSITQASIGIFVIDRSTLALIDRWAPAADYIGVSVTAAGQVAATGLPGFDAEGREAPWEGSLTIHDPVDGRVLVRFGRLGQGNSPLVVDR